MHKNDKTFYKGENSTLDDQTKILETLCDNFNKRRVAQRTSSRDSHNNSSITHNKVKLKHQIALFNPASAMAKTPHIHHTKSGSKTNEIATKYDYLNSRNSYENGEAMVDDQSVSKPVDSNHEHSNKDTNYEALNGFTTVNNDNLNTIGAHRSKSIAGHHPNGQDARDVKDVGQTEMNPNKAKKRNSKTSRSKWREFKVTSDLNSRQALKRVKQFNGDYQKHNI